MTSYEIQVEIRTKTARLRDLEAAARLSAKAAIELASLLGELRQLHFFLGQSEAAAADGF